MPRPRPAQVRKRERDSEAATGRLATDRRQAEDNLANSERHWGRTARAEFDRVLRQRRADTAGVTDETVAAERNNVSVAVEKVSRTGRP